jgi:uncharacterized membrane protein YvbJ
MKCRNCGNDLPEGIKTCYHCGQKVEGTYRAASGGAVDSVDTGSNPYAGTMYGGKPPKAGKQGRIILLFLISLLLIIIGIVLIIMGNK